MTDLFVEPIHKSDWSLLIKSLSSIIEACSPWEFLNKETHYFFMNIRHFIICIYHSTYEYLIIWSKPIEMCFVDPKCHHVPPDTDIYLLERDVVIIILPYALSMNKGSLHLKKNTSPTEVKSCFFRMMYRFLLNTMW